MNEDQILEARQRAAEYREMAEEYCPRGEFLFGESERDRDLVMEARETRQN